MEGKVTTIDISKHRNITKIKRQIRGGWINKCVYSKKKWHVEIFHKYICEYTSSITDILIYTHTHTVKARTHIKIKLTYIYVHNKVFLFDRGRRRRRHLS